MWPSSPAAEFSSGFEVCREVAAEFATRPLACVFSIKLHPIIDINTLSRYIGADPACARAATPSASNNCRRESDVHHRPDLDLVARRLEPSIHGGQARPELKPRRWTGRAHGCPVQHFAAAIQRCMGHRTTFGPPWPDLVRPPTSSNMARRTVGKAWMAGTSPAKGILGCIERVTNNRLGHRR